MNLKFTPSNKLSKKSRLELEQSGLKYCSRCDQVKSLKADFYHPASLHGKPQSNCKQCIAQIEKEYKKTDEGRAKRNRNSAKYWENHKDDANSSVRFSKAKAQAKRSKHEWLLSETEYSLFILKPCEYCGFNVGYGIGLDRINNNIGYALRNVVPCCGECNTARMDNFTSDEMRQYIGPAIRAAKLSREARR